ncbi:hypothetical protein ACRAWD_03585 [Caulobacter segnis]
MRVRNRTPWPGRWTSSPSPRRAKLDYIEFDAQWYGDGTDPSDATRAIPALDMPAIVAAARERAGRRPLCRSGAGHAPARRDPEDLPGLGRGGRSKFAFVWEGRGLDVRFITDLVRRRGDNASRRTCIDNLASAGWRTLIRTASPEESGTEAVPDRALATSPCCSRGRWPGRSTTPIWRPRAQPDDQRPPAGLRRPSTTTSTFLYWYDAPEKQVGKPWPYEVNGSDECPTTWDETAPCTARSARHKAGHRRALAWALMTNETPRAGKSPGLPVVTTSPSALARPRRPIRRR